MKILNTDSLCFSSTKTSSTTSSTTSPSPSHGINTVSVSSRLHGMIIFNTHNLLFSSTTPFSASPPPPPPSTSLDINTASVSCRLQGLLRDDDRKAGVHSNQWTLRDFLVSWVRPLLFRKGTHHVLPWFQNILPNILVQIPLAFFVQTSRDYGWWWFLWEISISGK